jgi:hypothetical protein
MNRRARRAAGIEITKRVRVIAVDVIGHTALARAAVAALDDGATDELISAAVEALRIARESFVRGADLVIELGPSHPDVVTLGRHLEQNRQEQEALNLRLLDFVTLPETSGPEN